MTKKKVEPKAELAALKKTSKVLERASEAKDKAKQKLAVASQAYSDAVALEVKELLRDLKWEKAKGRGATGYVEAQLPKGHRLGKIFDTLDTYGEGFCRWNYTTFDGIKLERNTRGWQYTSWIRGSRDELTRLGVKLKAAPEAVERRKLVAKMKKAGVTAEEIETFLASRKSG